MHVSSDSLFGVPQPLTGSRTPAVIVLSGPLGSPDAYHGWIPPNALVVCCDGGADNARTLGLAADIVIGDMDSISPEVLAELEASATTEVIHDPDQNKTDFELALDHAAHHGADGYLVLGGLGGRLDHALANLACMPRVPAHHPLIMLDPDHEVRLVRDQVVIQGVRGQVVSVLPLTDIRGLAYTGLHWDPQTSDVKCGWLGICNILAQPRATIKLTSGVALVIRLRGAPEAKNLTAIRGSGGAGA